MFQESSIAVSFLYGMVQAADSVMIQLKVPGVRREAFNSTLLTASIQRLLPVWGYPDVRVTIHAVFTSQQQLQ